MSRYRAGLVDPKSLEPVLLQFAPVRSSSLLFAPVRSSSLLFVRTQNCLSRNQRNVEKQLDLVEESVNHNFHSRNRLMKKLKGSGRTQPGSI